MSEPIKLKNPGDTHSLDVQSCAKVPTGKYPEWEFVGRDGTRVRVPESAFTRQMTRLALTAETVVGRRVTISRGANTSDPSKPYWNIETNGSGAETTKGGPSNGGSQATPSPASLPPGTTPAAQPAPQNGHEKDSALYVRMTRFVLKDIRPLYEDAGLPFDANVAAAITATLYIQAKR